MVRLLDNSNAWLPLKLEEGWIIKLNLDGSVEHFQEWRRLGLRIKES